MHDEQYTIHVEEVHGGGGGGGVIDAVLAVLDCHPGDHKPKDAAHKRKVSPPLPKKETL